ncbi:MAG: hypothetical protein ACK4PI_06215 [Tepidisphaerales bacterium]
MLPASVLERFTATRGVRFDFSQLGKRGAVRVPLRFPALVYPADSGQVGQPVRVTLKDISLTGVGVLLPQRVRVPRTWLLCLGPQPMTTRRSLVLRCETARAVQAGPWLWLLGGVIDAMLLPEQTLSVGSAVQTYRWLATREDTPADPLLTASPARTHPAASAPATDGPDAAAVGPDGEMATAPGGGTVAA